MFESSICDASEARFEQTAKFALFNTYLVKRTDQKQLNLWSLM